MTRTVLFILLLLAGNALQVHAAQVLARIDHTSEYTTNTARTETNEIVSVLAPAPVGIEADNHNGGQ